MSKIAIVDDNKDQRDTNTIRLRLFLKKIKSNLEVVDTFPFQKYDEYYRFIEKENIVGLIVDEKLHNDSQPDNPPVDYNGSDLVVRIRERYKYIPFFTLTNFAADPTILEHFENYEYIISKKDFTEKHVSIIHRACQRYLIENQKELIEFDELSKKIASGEGKKSDLEKLKALQLKLQIPLSVDLGDRQEWLIEYEKQLDSLEKIKSILKDKKKGNSKPIKKIAKDIAQNKLSKNKARIIKKGKRK
jgi:hypothetical protein